MEHTLLLLSASSSPLPSLFTHHSQKLTFSSKHTLIKSPPITIKLKSFTSNHSLKVNCGETSSSSSDYFQQSSPPRFSPSYSPPSSPTFSPASPPKVFVGHSIYKGKAALTVEPKAPEFAPLESGALKLSREGFVLLQFAPAAGVRQYDWSRKQVFSLSVSEIGSLISLGAKESCEYFHDPNKGKSDEGKVRKVLKVEPLPDGSGHFFNLSVQNKLLNMDESIYIPITKAEFAVLVSAFNVGMPLLIQYDQQRTTASTTQAQGAASTMNGAGRLDNTT